MNEKIVVKRNKCSACGDCREVCPQEILKIRKVSSDEKKRMGFFQRIDCWWHKNKRLEVIDQAKCIGCGLCLKACSHNALYLKEFDVPPRSGRLREDRY